MSKQKVLIVDDDPHIAELISLYLTRECYETALAATGPEALSQWKSFQPDLILLDIMLPGMDGYQVCQEIRRESDVPIMMLSAKGEVFDKVLGLELGADDYMIKPFDNKEMVARVKALLRRAQKRIQPAESGEKKVSFPDLEINLSNYTVLFRGESLDMSAKEMEILYYLAVSPGQVFTREQILDGVWGYEYVGDPRTVDVYIKRLRQKLPTHAAWQLSTVWGVGYRFEVLSPQ